MIKVLVPATHGSKENRESPTEWIPASPHVDREYPIWPSGCINLDYGVNLSRLQNDCEKVVYENQIKISAYGGTQVFVGGIPISQMREYESFDVAQGIYVRRDMSRTFLVIVEESGECKLEVVRNGKKVALAKLVRVIGAKADKIRKEEDRVNGKCGTLICT